MKIETKYSTNDKVWVLIPNSNSEYMWANIESMDIRIRCGKVDGIEYHIVNRYYDKRLWENSYMFNSLRDWKMEQYLNYQENEIYSSESELLDVFMANKDEEVMCLHEFKKGFFNNS